MGMTPEEIEAARKRIEKMTIVGKDKKTHLKITIVQVAENVYDAQMMSMKHLVTDFGKKNTLNENTKIV